ncbi:MULTISPECIES: MFS transporter [unclassified Lactobacillus]|uniref:MFS transporter n=1 Tax=unclassified Lactobacillus TaxID=2620435 RepID=UPI000EFD86A3|nr:MULTISPECIES: MFS transporter [unclassified Lactobacillus]RMC23576.1 MFS transporter [Lactobacillus sp. ESL0247]RMC27375.1 MFS transporter [Lactobacillus sp. ESL0246]RMC30501.1 MFS transporter [Lactobacillus sp. ESL0245]
MDIFLKNSKYRKFSLASILSSAGDILFYLALVTYASKLKNYSLALSLIAISESVPKLFASVGGYLADQTRNKFQKIVWLAAFRGVLYLLVGVLFSLNIAGWNLVMMVIIINFFSDTAGIYSTGLMTPIIVNLVKEDQVAEAEGFTAGVSQIITMVAQFVGAGMLLFMSYSMLAIVNSATFIIAGIIYWSVERGQISSTIQNEIEKRSFFSVVTKSFGQVKTASGLLSTVLVLALLNGVLSTIEPLIAIVVAGNRQKMIIGTYSFTIALVGGAAAVGISLGSIWGVKIFKKVSLYKIILLATIAAIVVTSALIIKQIFWGLAAYSLLGFFAGIASPKLTQWMVSTVERQILASTVGLLNTILLLVSPIMTTVFTTISAVSRVNYSLGLLLTVNGMVLIITLVLMKKEVNK